MTSLTNQTIDRPRHVTRLSTGLALEAFLVLNTASYFLAFLLRGRFLIPDEVMVWFWTTLPVVLGVKSVVLLSVLSRTKTFTQFAFKANHVLFVAASLSAIGIYVLNLSLFKEYLYPIPRSVIAIDWALSLIFWIRLRAIGMQFVKGTAIRTVERTVRPRRKEIPTISMGSGGPKVNC